MIPRTVTPSMSVLRLSSSPTCPHVIGVLELEVAVHELAGVGEEGGGLGLVEPESPRARPRPAAPARPRPEPLVHAAGLLLEPCGWSLNNSSSARWTRVPFRAGRRRRLGQVLDDRETERERAIRKRP